MGSLLPPAKTMHTYLSRSPLFVQPKAAAQGTVDIRSFFGGKPKPKPAGAWRLPAAAALSLASTVLFCRPSLNVLVGDHVVPPPFDLCLAAETSPAAPKKVEEQPPAPPQPAAPPCDAASSGGSKPARTPSRGKGATPSKSNAGGTNSGSKGKAAAAAPAAGAPTAKSPASGSGSKKRAPAGRPTSRAQAKRKQVVDSDDEGGAGSDSWDDGGEESGSGSDLEVDLTMSDAEVEAAPVAAAGSAGKKQKEQQTKAPAAGKQKAEAAAVGEPAAKVRWEPLSRAGAAFPLLAGCAAGLACHCTIAEWACACIFSQIRSDSIFWVLLLPESLAGWLPNCASAPTFPNPSSVTHAARQGHAPLSSLEEAAGSPAAHCWCAWTAGCCTCFTGMLAERRWPCSLAPAAVVVIHRVDVHINRFIHPLAPVSRQTIRMPWLRWLRLMLPQRSCQSSN